MSDAQAKLQEVVLGETECRALIVEADDGGVIIRKGPDLHVPKEHLDNLDRIGKEMFEEEQQHRAAGEIECDQCGEWFKPRSSGGRPQRFCAEECRRAFHVENPNANQRDQRGEPFVGVTPNAPRPPDDYEWDWNACGCLAVPRQDGIAVYWNRDGDACIRRESQHHPCEDEFISIPPQHLGLVIAALQEKQKEFEQEGGAA